LPGHDRPVGGDHDITGIDDVAVFIAAVYYGFNIFDTLDDVTNTTAFLAFLLVALGLAFTLGPLFNSIYQRSIRNQEAAVRATIVGLMCLTILVIANMAVFFVVLCSAFVFADKFSVSLYPNIVEAIDMAINKDELVSEILSGYGIAIDGPYP